MVFSIQCNANIASGILVAFLRCCFGIVLSHVHLQLSRVFAGVVALLAGKRSLAGVRKHVEL